LADGGSNVPERDFLKYTCFQICRAKVNFDMKLSQTALHPHSDLAVVRVLGRLFEVLQCVILELLPFIQVVFGLHEILHHHLDNDILETID